MKNGAKIAMAAVALMAMGIGSANAKLTAANRTGSSVWITLYDGYGSQLASQCLTTGSDKVWKGGGFLSTKIGTPGETVYLRGELKENTNCGGRTLSDTGRGGTIMIGSSTVKTFSVVSGKIHKG